jgi:hypothetical protein
VVGNSCSVLVAFANSPSFLGTGSSAGVDDKAEDSLYDRFLSMAGTMYAFRCFVVALDAIVPPLNP